MNRSWPRDVIVGPNRRSDGDRRRRRRPERESLVHRAPGIGGRLSAGSRRVRELTGPRATHVRLFDLRYAWRSLRRTPVFTTATVRSPRRGVRRQPSSACSTRWSSVRFLPDPERLVVVHEVLPKSVTPRSPVSAAHFEEWRAAARSFEQMALLFPASFTLNGTSEAEQIGGARASASLFRMLGAPILHGRTFSEEEDALGRDRVVLLGYDLWKRRFAGDAAIVGQQVRLDGDYTGLVPRPVSTFRPRSPYPITGAADRPQI